MAERRRLRNTAAAARIVIKLEQVTESLREIEVEPLAKSRRKRFRKPFRVKGFTHRAD